MSIQRRLAISTTLVLVFSLVVGFVLTYEHVRSKVRTELQAALAVGADSALDALDERDDVEDPGRKLGRIVAAFDGDRHLKAIFTAPGGKILARSNLLAPEDPAPGWFYRLVASPSPRKVLSLPGRFHPLGTVTLEADPLNEMAEAWGDVRLTLTVMAVFFSMVLALAFVTIRAALAPIREVQVALERIGGGDYTARIGPQIAHELAPLRAGFNAMATCLEGMARQNRALNEQIMTLQEEERAELARDLHDDVAPFLFAVGADAAMIRQFLANGAVEDVAPRADAIGDAVKHMQRHVKDVLRRLAPSALLDLGLAGAIDNLVGFWKTRRPDVAFHIHIEGEPLDPPLDTIAFRIVQESMSNAVRHGRPDRIDVTLHVDERAATIVVKDDGVGFRDDTPTLGFGLTGMRERIRAAGGTLALRNGATGRGAIVEAVLPLWTKTLAENPRKLDIPA
jgi:two-component system sensor histidine kinase UhpB